MTHPTTRRARFGRQRLRRQRQRRRSIVMLGTAVVAGMTLGMGGSTLALWQDATGWSAAAKSGYEYFAAGAPGHLQPATNGTVEFTVGSDEATTLQSEGQIAIPMQTESLSQGNKGLRYTVTEPAWGDHFFGAAATTLFQVASRDDCSVDNSPIAPREPTSTPVDAEYSDSEEPVVETWCLVATLEALPDEGTYSNSVTATAQDPAEVSVEATDTWHAEITSTMDPTDEPDHVITFDYETFRPTADD